MTNYYVIIRGHTPGIYRQAERALIELDDFPDAFVKTFAEQASAELYWETHGPAPAPTQVEDAENIDVYVDGSFDRDTARYSYGAVFVQDGQPVQTLTRVGNNERYTASHQIAGEVFGALAAIQWAARNGFEQVTVHYDYLGIEKWATGEWRAKRPVSQDYAAHFKKLADKIRVKFVKVKAHTGDTFNEMADDLAKDALKN